MIQIWDYFRANARRPVLSDVQVLRNELDGAAQEAFDGFEAILAQPPQIAPTIVVSVLGGRKPGIESIVKELHRRMTERIVETRTVAWDGHPIAVSVKYGRRFAKATAFDYAILALVVLGFLSLKWVPQEIYGWAFILLGAVASVWLASWIFRRAEALSRVEGGAVGVGPFAALQRLRHRRLFPHAAAALTGLGQFLAILVYGEPGWNDTLISAAVLMGMAGLARVTREGTFLVRGASRMQRAPIRKTSAPLL